MQEIFTSTKPLRVWYSRLHNIEYRIRKGESLTTNRQGKIRECKSRAEMTKCSAPCPSRLPSFQRLYLIGFRAIIIYIGVNSFSLPPATKQSAARARLFAVF